MWTREIIKARAKKFLRGAYLQAFVVSLIVAIIAGTDTIINISERNEKYFRRYFEWLHIDFDIFDIILKFMIFFTSFSLLIIIFRIVIGSLIAVGGKKYFIQAVQGDMDFGYLSHGFTKDRFLEIVLTMFVMSVYIFLWSLLLIIPGIVKSYAYRMVPYILADNPTIGYKRAIELSNDITMGEKFDIFILDLSFMGWYILGFLALFVGVLFVKPYEEATNAELYIILREEAISKGLTTYEELNLVKEETTIEF